MLLCNGIASRTRWSLLQRGGQNFSCPDFLFFNQSDGASGGAGLVMFATANVRQPVWGAKQILPKITTSSHFRRSLSNGSILMGARLNVSKTKRGLESSRVTDCLVYLVVYYFLIKLISRDLLIVISRKFFNVASIFFFFWGWGGIAQSALLHQPPLLKSAH